MIDHLRVPVAFDRRQRALHGEENAKQIGETSHRLLIVVTMDQVSPRQLDVPILQIDDRANVDGIRLLLSVSVSRTGEGGKDQQSHGQLDENHVAIESFGSQSTIMRRCRSID